MIKLNNLSVGYSDSEAIAAERDSIEQLLDFASGVAGKEGEQ